MPKGIVKFPVESRKDECLRCRKVGEAIHHSDRIFMLFRVPPQAQVGDKAVEIGTRIR